MWQPLPPQPPLTMPQPATTPSLSAAQALNLGCACQTLVPQRMHEAIEATPGLRGLGGSLALSHPHLFSPTVVFLDAHVHRQITQAIQAMEAVAALPSWKEQALGRAPAIARQHWGPAGVFMGYDFHLTHQGPKLIEINSNAGGAFLMSAAARAHRACCEAFEVFLGTGSESESLEAAMVDMFQSEWRTQRPNQPLRNVLIVDDRPGEQYLAPEFEIVRALLADQGWLAVVADPQELQWRDGALWHPVLPADMPVDLVYNRLTDFYLQEPAHLALRHAYETGAAVITPGPRTHALHADKRNLITLSNPALLRSWGVDEPALDLLAQTVPCTQAVNAAEAESLWAQRRGLFFKPVAGFGSRGAYRGDKLTRRVWSDILASDYVAQATVAPSERLVMVQGEARHLKVDLRAYTYQGRVQQLAARTWAGQTTNFRTEGGGFSPVIVLPQPTPTPPAADARKVDSNLQDATID
jgi:hypothetical protein